MKEQHACVKFCFRLWETASEVQKNEAELLLKTRNHTAALTLQETALTTSTQYKATQIVYQEYVDLFWNSMTLLIRNLFLQAKWLTVVSSGRFCNTKKASPPKMPRMIEASQFAMTMWQHTVTARIFCHQQTWL
jgi:hypothetical protein